MKSKELVLVTGGAGFIGGHLVDELIAKGYDVRILDSLARPTHNGQPPSWLNPKAEFIKGDVKKKKDWAEALKGVNYVFHLASYMDYHLNFSEYFSVNTNSTALLYELVIEHNLPIKKIIVASSQSPYGEGKYLCKDHGIFYPEPRDETELKQHHWDVVCPQDGKPATIMAELETDELHPQIPYAISKTAAEQLCLTLGRTYRLPTVALRYSIVQGSRQSFRHYYSGALRDFCIRSLAGLPIVMQEDGSQIRDFVNVHDVVDAHLTVLEDSRADYQAFNVGSGKDTKVNELAKVVCEVVGIKYRPNLNGEFRINAPRNSKMNIDKLKSLGWAPSRTLEDSVEEYVAWVRDYPEAITYWQKTYKNMRKQNILKK